MSVLVFGSANADLIFPTPTLPAPGETVLGESWRASPGGKGANQATAAARAGARTHFIGAVGTDSLAEVALSGMAAAGVDLSGLARVGVATGAAAICVDARGANQISVASGANMAVRATQVADAELGPDTVLLLQMEVPVEEMVALVARARAAGARIILNLAPPAPVPEAMLRQIDLLVANEHEAAWLAASLGVAPEAAALRGALGIDVVVTRGEQGSEAATATGTHHQPAFQALAVDTTGAGDCWCGTLAAALDAGEDLPTAMRRASAAAAIAVGREGAAVAMPTATETEALLASA
ncbi:ribokinase [Pseudoroseomonas wenyumeiae]|uniref:Ribokinase n=1 Tax=Teichococcus wenyumeiae TaxID=2478470 RepID=A0A3A9J937_9PROT|nr:PfkB family carbohydrate kinase [Pseudoroseomonas wenyumeiae]RKK01135.1 ribokinase [Pseudoroseomonas wenyumeiae]RMI19383.1 ribokinase [Pseudoroseomonas wenyumeiae]RMI20306.1 ribokinase [Pseudoroseomonas wenyumeiae]